MKVFLPSIHNEQGITAQADAVTQFVTVWMRELGARAALMRPDSRLMQAAQDHANYLASRTGEQLKESMHRGLNGSYSNQRVMEAGYRLPSEYRPNANNIESCAREARGAEWAFIGLYNSPAHHAHLMGAVGFEDRVVYGVGVCEADYVILACPPEEVKR